VTLRNHKYAILLAATVGAALVESFTHRLLLRPVASDLAVLTAELLVLLIVFDRRVNRLVGFIAFAIAVASVLAHYALPPTYPEVPLRVIYHSALLLLVGYATIVILRNIFQQHVVRSDDVLGAVCGYLLAAAAWANLFMVIEIFVPESYSVGQRFGVQLDSWHGRIAVMTYVSLGSLTGVGSGAVVPVRPPATVLTTLEAVFGQFYIAIVVAQLVGARLSQALQRNSSP
jgi:voltage-gated potassium channel